MTVTTEQYSFHTGDTTTASATVEANIAIAESLVETYLRRELASEERTEDVRVWPKGLAYPKHTPVTALPTGSSLVIFNTATLTGASADISPLVGEVTAASTDAYPHSLPYASITYTGGWTAATLPVPIVRVVCLLARAFVAPASIKKPGVQAAAVGDVSQTWTSTAAESGAAIDAILPYGTAMIQGYRWRPR